MGDKINRLRRFMSTDVRSPSGLLGEICQNSPKKITQPLWKRIRKFCDHNILGQRVKVGRVLTQPYLDTTTLFVGVVTRSREKTQRRRCLAGKVWRALEWL